MDRVKNSVEESLLKKSIDMIRPIEAPSVCIGRILEEKCFARKYNYLTARKV